MDWTDCLLQGRCVIRRWRHAEFFQLYPSFPAARQRATPSCHVGIASPKI